VNCQGLITYERYLGKYYIESALSFTCLLDAAKRSFYRSLNANFGKVGRIASNEVITQLTKTKCFPFPVLYYGLEKHSSHSHPVFVATLRL